MKPSAADLAARRERVARRWELNDEVVLLRAGEPASWQGTDQHFAFLPHPDVAYLAALCRRFVLGRGSGLVSIQIAMLC